MSPVDVIPSAARHLFKRSLVVSLLGMTAVCTAAVPPDAAKAQRVALVNGPIKITAAHAELAQREVALYQGNVKLTSSAMVLTGDRLELRQPARGQFEARLTGKPARLTHAAMGDAPAMSASASSIVYDTRRAQVDMSGGVALTRGTDTLASDSMHYDVAARHISATGAGKGQVQITIQPENLPSSVSGKPPEKTKGR
jgi:lipopolysaccharide transport protein LptA